MAKSNCIMRSSSSAMLFVLFVDTTTAFMVGVRMPSCSSAMAESWYDAKMAAEAAVTAGTN